MQQGEAVRPVTNSWLPSREPIAAKVPEITALFWLIKVLTTGMGRPAEIT
jgi:uncharacterized membrane-anchored protein